MCPNKGPKRKASKGGKSTAQNEAAPTGLGSTCCVPRGQVSCQNPELIDKSPSIRFTCSNPHCPQSGLMHEKCFEKFQSLAMSCLGKHPRCRDWSEKQKLSSLWINRGYDLIFKMCECECGHGHIRRDLEFEEEMVDRTTAGQEKKKKKKSAEVVKPTLNVRRDKVSQKSVGNFSYNKHNKTKNGLKPVLDEFQEDNFETKQSIPGLHPARAPLKLNLNLSPVKSKEKVIKGKKSSTSKSSSIPDDDGWTTVSKGGLGRRETGEAPIETIKKRPMEDLNIRQLEVVHEVYQSDDGNISDNEGFSSIDDSQEASINNFSDVSYGTNCLETKLVGVSDIQIEEMLGNLVEEKLIEEIAKKKALVEVTCLVEQNKSMKDAFLSERERLLEDIQTLSNSNMELREASEAREHMLQMQISELQTAMDSEVHSKDSLQQQNNHLRRVIKCLEDEKEQSVASLAAARVEWNEQIAQAADMVKVHQETSLRILEKEKMKMTRDVEAMDERLESLSSSADTLREKIKFISMKNLDLEEKLETEKSVVRDLREQLEAERNAEILRTQSPTDGDFSQYQDNALDAITATSQEGCSAERRISSIQGNSMMMELLHTVKEEAMQASCKVEKLEGLVQELQWKQMLMERQLVKSDPASGDTRLASLKGKILDMARDWDQIGEKFNSTEGAQDKAYQQIEARSDCVDQQVLENKRLRADFAKFEEQMAALQVDMKRNRNQKQSLAHCKLN